MTRKRSPILPDLATAHEQGLNDFEAATGTQLFLPKGTPAPIVRKLNDGAVATMDTPTVQKQLREIGVEAMASERRSPEYLAKFVVSEIDKWAAPIKASGVYRRGVSAADRLARACPQRRADGIAIGFAEIPGSIL